MKLKYGPSVVARYLLRLRTGRFIGRRFEALRFEFPMRVVESGTGVERHGYPCARICDAAASVRCLKTVSAFFCCSGVMAA